MEVGSAPESLLALAPPSESSLLEWLQAKVPPSLLEEIAANDRGEDIDKHLAGLQVQLAELPPLGLLSWYPHEVLALERWNEPDKCYQHGPPSGERGHVKRLLACVILLRNVAYISGPYDGLSDEEFFIKSSVATLGQFTRSAVALEIPDRALGFLLWLFEAQPHCALRPFTAFCALALASVVGFGDASDEEIVQICNWVHAEEEHCRNALGREVESRRWLTGLNSYSDLNGRDPWLAIAKKAFEQPQRAYSASLRETLQRFTDRLAANQLLRGGRRSQLIALRESKRATHSDKEAS